MAHRRETLLAIVATDNTFERMQQGGRDVWVGKCIHCQSRLMVDAHGNTHNATIEHIVPTGLGGTDTLENLALACPRCNHGKGKRVDSLRRGDPRLEHVVSLLQTRRAARWRERPE